MLTSSFEKSYRPNVMLKWLGGSNNGSGNQSSRSTQIGKVFHINGHHVVVEDIIAEGGFAIVFVVKSGNGQRLALKRLAVNNEQDLYLTRQEIAITKALSDCRNSVTYISSVTKQVTKDVYEVLILMELYSGVSVIDLLNKHLSAGTRLSESRVLHIFSDICVAVGRLHHRTKPIIHRDLKIENILHDPHSDSYILCDYGSCSIKSMHPEEMGAAECSDEVARFTTLPYRSPEMVSVYSGKTITTKSDIWALGVLLYKLCFMETPFGEQPLAIVSGQFNIPPDSTYSQDLHSLIGYLLNPDPDQRPTIWQVSEIVFKLRKMTNPVPNVFRSPRPPVPLPSPKTAGKKKLTPISSSKPRTSSSVPHISVTPQTNTPRANPLAVTTTTISSRDRPRAKGQSSQQPANQKKGNSLIPETSHTHHKSVDSGLDVFGHVPFSHHRVRSEGQGLVVTQHSKADARRSKDDMQLGVHRPDDLFGCPPFIERPSTPNTTAAPVRRDLFGAPPFTGGSKNVPVDSFGAPPF